MFEAAHLQTDAPTKDQSWGVICVCSILADSGVKAENGLVICSYMSIYV